MARRQATTVNCENFRPFAVGPRKTERLERLPLQAETKRQALVCLQSTAVAENRKTTRRAGTHSQVGITFVNEVEGMVSKTSSLESPNTSTMFGFELRTI